MTWYDPMTTAAAGATMSGREHLQAMVDGTVPFAPIGALMSFRAERIEDGEVFFRCTPDESAYNPIGTVHGGLVCTVLDSVTAARCSRTLDAGVGYTSLEIKVSYLRPVRAGEGDLLAHGWVTKRGRRASFAEGEITDEAGKTVATASSTCLVFPMR